MAPITHHQLCLLKLPSRVIDDYRLTSPYFPAMVKHRDFDPFLFRSAVSNYSNPSSSSSSSLSLPSTLPCTSQSSASLNSPLKSSPLATSSSQSSASLNSPLELSLRAPSVSCSSLVPSSASVAARGPCAACKLLGRQCTEKCYTYAYPLDESALLTLVDRLFGGRASTFMNFIKEQEDIVNELTLGKELTVQLRHHLSSPETHESLVDKILWSYEKALSMLDWTSSIETNRTNGRSKSEHSFANSNSIVGSSFDYQPLVDVGKKRKHHETPSSWTVVVKLTSKSDLEWSYLDDGYNWRKYGQKDILGAKYPRSYYRCINRYSEGCLATKQVQRTDEDPTIFEVIYRGKHKCSTAPSSGTAMAYQSHESDQNKDDAQLENPPKELLSFEHLQMETAEDRFISFSFPGIKEIEENGSSRKPMFEHDFFGIPSSGVMSQAGPSTNYISTSPEPHTGSGIGSNEKIQ